MKRPQALLISGTGLLGSALARLLPEQALELTATSRKGGAGLLPLDLSSCIDPQLSVAFQKNSFTHGIICAAISVVDECFRNPVASRRVNVEAMKEILGLFREFGIRPVFFSTDMVFSGTGDLYEEGDPTGPTTVYGKQKLEIEEEIRKGFPDHLIFRTSKLLSMDLHPRSALTGVIEALSAGREVHAFTDQFLTPVFVEDVARALAGAIKFGLTGTYHLAMDQRLNRFELAKLIASKFGFSTGLVKPFSVKQAALSEPRGTNHTLSAKKILSALGFAFTPLENGLQEIKRTMPSAAAGKSDIN